MRPSYPNVLLGLVIGVLALADNVEAQAEAQFEARRIVVSASRSTLVAGERLQLSALARDENGASRTDGFDWGSNNDNILTVSSQGVVSARGVGATDVWVALDNAWTSLTLVVLPKSVALDAPLTEIFVGGRLQFSATALDANGNPIPGVHFEWAVSGPNGYYTQVASISNTGLLRASAAGRVTIKAILPIFGAAQVQVERIVATSDVVIRRNLDFRLRRLLATDPVEGSFELRPNSQPGMSANDVGQLALIAPLDGLATGVLRYDNGKWDLMTSAGTPGVFPRSYVWAFGNTSINRSGQVLSDSWTRGNRSSLWLSSTSGTVPILAEGQTQGVFQGIRNFSITRYSLNDDAQVVFRGTYDSSNGIVDRDGIFLLADGHLRVVWAATLPLAEFPDGFSIDRDFGIDGGGTVYFKVSRDGSQGIYRADGLSAPQKVVATGDSLGGSTIERIRGLGVAENGTLAFGIVLADDARGPARYDLASGLTMLETPSFDRIHSINDRGEVVFTGDTGNGWGFNRWDGTASTPVIVWGESAGGGHVRQFHEAVITRTGTVYSLVGTTENEMVVVESGSGRVLFQSGDRINVTANTDFMGFVPGAASGPPHIYTGGNPTSIFRVTSSGPEAVWVTGDGRPETASSGTMSSATRNPQGDLYLAVGSGVFRHTGSTLQTLLEYPVTLGSGIFSTFTLNWTASWFDGSNYFAANDAGLLVWNAWSENESRLVSIENGRMAMLASFGGSDQTVAPAGGAFAGLFSGGSTGNAIAVDDAGRVMISARVANGPDGVYLFENGNWETAALFGTTQVGGQFINWLDGLRVAGQRFYAVFNRTNGGSVLASYENGQWTPIFGNGDRMPNGSQVFYISRDFDVNRRGDVAFVVNNNGGTELVLRTADGTIRTVYRTGEATPEGDRFWPYQNFELDLRDDGSLYFMGIDLLDRNVLYFAEPLF